jgi:hypothetical protein
MTAGINVSSWIRSRALKIASFHGSGRFDRQPERQCADGLRATGISKILGGVNAIGLIGTVETAD